MNTVNQTFDWSRFTATLRKEVVENGRMLMFTVIAIYALLSIVMIFGNLFTSLSGESIEDMTAEIGAKPQYMMVGYIMSFVITIVASFSFKKLTRKTGRIDLFTSPSSTLEKFLVNIVVYVLGFFVVYIICAQLADLTRIAALWYFHDRIEVPGPINFLATFSQAYNFGGIDIFGMSKAFTLVLIANAGMFLLGSVLWPRLSWLKTFAALYAVEIVLGILALIVALIIGKENAQAFFDWLRSFITADNMKYWFGGIVFQVILYWGLAWYLFKRKDVISLKWWK